MEPVEYPINGILDLHEFRPEELGSLVPEYLRACREKGLRRVRIVHGKGTGALRRSVHAILERRPEVERFHLAGDRSGWGATIAHLQLPAEDDGQDAGGQDAGGEGNA